MKPFVDISRLPDPVLDNGAVWAALPNQFTRGIWNFGTNFPFTNDPPNGLPELDTPPDRGTEPRVSGGFLGLSMNQWAPKNYTSCAGLAEL